MRRSLSFPRVARVSFIVSVSDTGPLETALIITKQRFVWEDCLDLKRYFLSKNKILVHVKDEHKSNEWGHYWWKTRTNLFFIYIFINLYIKKLYFKIYRQRSEAGALYKIGIRYRWQIGKYVNWIALSVYSLASSGMRETVSDVESGEKCLGNSEYWPIVRTVVAPTVSRV